MSECAFHCHGISTQGRIPYKVNVGVASFWSSGFGRIASNRQPSEHVIQIGGKPMKSLGLITVLSVAVTALAPGVQSRPPAGTETAKSVQAFTECFKRAQDVHAAAWAFVPSRSGGTFSNFGAAGVDKPYFIVVRDRGNRRDIVLDNVAAASPAALGVSQCA